MFYGSSAYIFWQNMGERVSGLTCKMLQVSLEDLRYTLARMDNNSGADDFNIIKLEPATSAVQRAMACFSDMPNWVFGVFSYSA